MRDDQHRFLALAGQLPARLTAEQAAWMLGCQAHDVPILVATRLLKPLGNPPPNGIKFFAASDVAEYAKDRNWLTRMTVAITNHWKGQNGRRTKGSSDSVDPRGTLGSALASASRE